MTGPIPVVMAADAAYAMQLAVAIASMAAASASSRFAVHVLHPGIPAEVRQKVEASRHDRVDIAWITIDPTSLSTVGTDNRLPMSTLYRLLMPEVLPDGLDRVVYLDCDLIVRRDLTQLWEISTGGSPCAAVRDARIVSIGTPDGPPWRALGLDPHGPYFNAGVMLVDLDAWRRDSVGSRALASMHSHRFPQMDQGSLNAVLSGRWARLPPTWNLQGSHFVDRNNLAWTVEPTSELEAAYADPAIVHFSGLSKPWNARCAHPYRDEWLDLLEQTAWAGWRPPRAIVKRGAARVRRAMDTIRKG